MSGRINRIVRGICLIAIVTLVFILPYTCTYGARFLGTRDTLKIHHAP